MAKEGQRKGLAKKAGFICACVVLLVLFVLHVTYRAPIDESFLKEYQQFDSYEQVNDKPVVYRVAKEEKPVGYLVMDSHYGYQSTITMATLVSDGGEVLDARAYSQAETPSYFRKLVGNGFFKRNFVGDQIQDGFSIHTNVDAISHATISSNACTRAVQKGVSYVGEHYLDTDVQEHDSDLKVGLLDIGVFVMLILALVTMHFAKSKVLTWVCRVYSVVVMGFISSQFITLTVLVAFFSLDWPSVVDYLRWYLLVFGVLAIILVTGKNTYCARICPFGALQEITFSVSGSVGKKPLNPKVRKVLRFAPGLLVFVSLVLTFAFHNLDYACYEPFSLIFGQVGVGVQWAMLPVVLIGSFFCRRIYCSFACPVGYVLNKIVFLRSRVARFVKEKTLANKAQEAKAIKVKAAKDGVAKTGPSTCELVDEGGAAGIPAAKPSDTAKKAKVKSAAEKRFTGYDVFVLTIASLTVVISLLTIIAASGVFN